MYAHYGVTSVIGMGGDGDDVLKIRDAQRHGDIRGARLYTVLTRFEFEKDARTPDEARAKVDDLYTRGADAVKIVVDDRRHTVAKLKPEIQLAVIDQAHKHGLKAMAHEYYYDDAQFLMDHGLDIFAHEIRDRVVDDAFIDELKAKHITVIPTLVREISSLYLRRFARLAQRPVPAEIHAGCTRRGGPNQTERSGRQGPRHRPQPP